MADLQPALEPLPYPPVHIERCVADVGRVRDRLTAHRQQLETQVVGLGRELSSHLWVMPDFVDPAAAKLRVQLQSADELLARVGKVIRGYDALPRADTPDFDDEPKA